MRLNVQVIKYEQGISIRIYVNRCSCCESWGWGVKKQFSAVKQTEKIVHILKNAIQSKGRFSLSNITEWTDLSRSSANVISRQLVKEGYLTSDGCKPLGFKATDKAEQLFWVAV